MNFLRCMHKSYEAHFGDKSVTDMYALCMLGVYKDK